MQVMPKGYVGLAGAVVMWFVENGQRHLLMVRQAKGGDGKARFLSCMGVGPHADIGVALKATAKGQFGDVFTRSVLGKGILQADRVACAPLFNYTDAAVGVSSPVQSLVWVVQVHPQVLDVIHTPDGFQAVRVPENLVTSDKVSPTHQALFATVQRHLPKMKAMPVSNAEIVEETVREIAAATRVVH